MKNRVCEILGIKYPVIQGGMQWVSSDASLVTAVSEAGGLGVLATAGAEKEYVRGEIKKIKQGTNKPFAVNITVLSETAKDVITAAIEEKAPFIVTTAGNPAPFIPLLKEVGIPFLSVVATVKQAVKMEQLGASIIVVEGQESGGHIGEMTTMTLVPQTASAVKIPVIAAGGIADGRGMAAAFMLGAEGIQMGTAFIVSKECSAHQDFKNAVLNADSGSVVVTGRQISHAVRCLDNDLAKAFKALDARSAAPDEYAKTGTGSVYKAVRGGDVVNGSVMIGQIVGLVNSEKTAAQIIQNVVHQYNELRLGLPEVS